MIADYHVHSDISPDSQESMTAIAEAALAQGLTEIAVTDHYDEDYPDSAFSRPDLPRYFAELERVRAACPQLTVRSGTELGMVREAADKIRDFLAGWSFDFVLFSKHVVRGKDPWNEDYYDGRTLREGEREYLLEMLQDIQAWQDYDVVGHIGYADKYLQRYKSPPAGRPFEYGDFPDELDALLGEIIGAGKGIELNTSTFPSWGEGMPRRSVLKRYRELGGEIITLGSDAHQAVRVGADFPAAQELLADCGFRWICTFQERQPQFHRLPGAGR